MRLQCVTVIVAARKKMKVIHRLWPPDSSRPHQTASYCVSRIIFPFLLLCKNVRFGRVQFDEKKQFVIIFEENALIRFKFPKNELK